MEVKKKNRPLELGKDILIVLLACSAVYLALRTLSMSSAVGREPESAVSEQTQGQARASLIWPVRVAMSSWKDENMMRLGVQYDRESCDLYFQPVANLLREALTGLGEPREVDRAQWDRALSHTSNLYFDLLGELPLVIISQWMTGVDTGIQGTVRRLILSEEEGRVTLYYRNETDGNYYACKAGVVTAEQLEAAVQSVNDNGASFAFELEQYEGLSPDTMLLPQQPQPRVYTALNPLAIEGETDRPEPDSRLAGVLQALSFPASSYTYSGVDQVFLSGNDVLRISESGTVRYNAADGERSRYLIPSKQPEPQLPQIAEACRQLVSGAVEPLLGAGRIFLSEIREEEDGWILEFGYCLDGARVHVGELGYGARFHVVDGEIIQFTIQLREYTDTGSRSIVLPELQAMAAMEAMGERGSALELVYHDVGGESVTAGWMAE